MRTSDLLSISSGLAHIGVDGGPNVGAFDITSLAPYGHIHQLSGIFHDPTLGQSGVLRYSRASAAFQLSVDGGLTFNNILTGAAAVTSVGVVGGANLTGDIDLSSPSGFIVIGDTGGASPITFALDVWALSGLWQFPSNGFGNIPQCYAETFVAATTWVVTHNLNTTDVIVSVYDGGSPAMELIPDDIEVTDANNITINFNQPQAGKAVVLGC